MLKNWVRRQCKCLFDFFEKTENTSTLSNVIRVKAEGKEGAMITELYTVYRAELLKYCCMVCGNISDAEDLLQETFMKALSNLDLLKNWARKNDGPGCTRWQEICSMMPAEGEP